MKKLLLILLSVLSLTAVEGQIPEATENAQSVAEPTEEDVVYVIVEEAPEFPGGVGALKKFLRENLMFPVSAREKGILNARVICQFTVNKDGSIVDIEVVQSGGDPSFDKEAIRVVGSMPTWIPGRQRGRAVRVKYIMPVFFKSEQ